MKSIKIFATVGAIALLGMTGLTSCNQKNTPVDPGNGNYKGETVKTEFLINISDEVLGSPSATRRMPGSTLQLDDEGDGGLRDEFRGMEKIVLFPFFDEPSTSTTSNSKRSGKNISNLDPLLSTGDPANEKILTDKNAVCYQDVAIPLGTTHFLFYAKAIDNTADAVISSDADMHKFGFITPVGLNANSEPENVSFNLKPIHSTVPTSTKSDNLLLYLTSVINAQAGGVYWRNYEVPALVDLYQKLRAMKAGSSYAILAAVEDLYNTLERFNATQETDDPMALAIMAAILGDPDPESANRVVKVDDGIASPVAYAHVLTWKDESKYGGYPADINLPEGAAVIKWVASPTYAFTRVTNPANLGGSSFSIVDITRFVYPAALWYYGNSKIATSPISQIENYNNTNEWDAILDKYEKEGDEVKDGTVTTNTKSVAIKDPINYGVAQLKTTFKRQYVDLEDADGNVFKKEDANTQKLFVKGVLVSGQKQVDYKFEQVDAEATPYVIYDNIMHGTTNENKGLIEIPTGTGTITPIENYTLVFSTKDNKAGENTPGNDEVFIAIELVNNLGDFKGVDGLIPAGATFYLIAKLNASETSPGYSINKSNHPDNYNLFYKDFITTANLTIGPDALKSAYYTIPDLRSSDLELGFSVNLAWQPGLIFDITL